MKPQIEFIKTMLEEKGVQLDQDVKEGHINLSYEDLLIFLDKMPTAMLNTIKDTFSKIDFKNGDVLHYAKHLFDGMLKSQGYDV